MKRDLLTLADVTPDEIWQILTLALDLKQRLKRGESTSLLAGKSLVLLFSKPSLRTRASFEVGMAQLGGHTSYFEDPEIVLGKLASRVTGAMLLVFGGLPALTMASFLGGFRPATALQVSLAATAAVVEAGCLAVYFSATCADTASSLRRTYGWIIGAHLAVGVGWIATPAGLLLFTLQAGDSNASFAGLLYAYPIFLGFRYAQPQALFCRLLRRLRMQTSISRKSLGNDKDLTPGDRLDSTFSRGSDG